MNTESIGWVLSGDRSIASCRLQGYHVHDFFLERGIRSEIIVNNFNTDHARYSLSLLALARRIIRTRYDLVFMQRPNWMMYKLSDLLRITGTRTVALRCDLLEGEYDGHFDATIVPTPDLASALGISRYHVIDDMIEVPEGCYKRNYAQTSDKLRIVWVGHGSYRRFILDFIERLRASIGLQDLDFLTISNANWADIPWSLEAVHQTVPTCDIAIIPMPSSPEYQIKSTNRLTMFMAMGLPTIITPIASYARIARAGETCLIANNVGEFAESIGSLRNPSMREGIGMKAREFAREHFSRANIGRSWEAVANEVLRSEQAAFSPPYHTRLLSGMLRLGI